MTIRTHQIALRNLCQNYIHRKMPSNGIPDTEQLYSSRTVVPIHTFGREKISTIITGSFCFECGKQRRILRCMSSFILPNLFGVLLGPGLFVCSGLFYICKRHKIAHDVGIPPTLSRRAGGNFRREARPPTRLVDVIGSRTRPAPLLAGRTNWR